jgi:hypothetical protein
LPQEAGETGELILFLDQLFDSLNGNNKEAANSKPLKGGVSKSSPHDQFWREAIKILQSMKFFNKKKQTFVKVPSTVNLIKTLQGFLYLRQKLLNNMTYFLPRALNQDCIENFFSAIRTHGRRNVNPSAAQFVTSFKTLVLNNFMSTHAVGANCEKDFATGALNNLRCFVNGEEVAGVQLLGESEEPASVNVPLAATKIRKTRVAKSTCAYIAGFICKKALKKAHCQNCRDVLLYSDGSVPLEVIQARQYRHSNLQKPGSFLYFCTSTALTILFDVIPKICNCLNIKVVLSNILMKNIDLTPLTCVNKHKMGSIVVKFIIKTILHFWCKQVNKLLHGKDEKFVLLTKNKKIVITDKVKVLARKMYVSKLKYKQRK